MTDHEFADAVKDAIIDDAFDHCTFDFDDVVHERAFDVVFDAAWKKFHTKRVWNPAFNTAWERTVNEIADDADEEAFDAALQKNISALFDAHLERMMDERMDREYEAAYDRAMEIMSKSLSGLRKRSDKKAAKNGDAMAIGANKAPLQKNGEITGN